MYGHHDFICTARSCYNSKVNHPSLGFFSFPSDAETCKIWLENCDRTDLSVDNVVRLRDQYKLCSDHFERKYFSNSCKRHFSHTTKNLNPIPTIFRGNALELPCMENCHENTSLDIVPDQHMNEVLEEENLVRDLECDLVPTELLVKCHQPSVSFNDIQLSKRLNEERDTIAKAVLCLEPTTELHHIESLCRLCMNLASDDDIRIFSNTAEAREIRRMCQIVLPNRIQLGDGLPQRICHLCIPDLKTCGTFMDKLKKADVYLRQIGKYSLFVEDDEINDIVGDSTLSDKDFIQPVSKKALVIPLDRFNTHNALIQKSLEIFNGKSVNNTARISKKPSPIQDEIKLVCLNILKSTEEEDSQPTKQANQTVKEDQTLSNEEVDPAINNDEMTSIMPIDEGGDITKIDEGNHDQNLFTNSCPKEIIDSSNIDPSTRLSYKCLECRDVLDSYPALVNHVLTLHREGSRIMRLKDLMRQKGTEGQSRRVRRRRASRKLQCKQCDPTQREVFNSKAELVEHIAKQHVHRCSICDRVLTSAARLRNHEMRHDGCTQCSKCGLTLKTRWLRRQHEASHNSEQSRVCEICGVLLPPSITFESHMKKHLMYCCEICGKQLKNYKSYLTHKQYHSKHHKCNICFRRFATIRSFEMHKIRHVRNVNLFPWPTKCSVCEFCGAKLYSKNSLERHLMVRENLGYCPRRQRRKMLQVKETQHKCSICGKKYLYFNTLQRHRQHIHRCNGDSAVEIQEETEHECNICGKKYLHFKNLQKHKRLVHLCNKDPVVDIQEETQYDCDVCGKKFVKVSNMQSHRRLHFCNGDPAAIQLLLDEPEVKTCHVCQKDYFGRLIFQKHSQRHTGSTTPYVCIICDKTFASCQDYRIHERSEHTNDQPFECKQCDKRFYMQHLLKNHSKVFHPKIKHFSRDKGLYVCNICSMKFKSKFAVRLHSKVNHYRDIHACKICNKEFISPSSLAYHSLVHKGERCACLLCGKTFKHKIGLAHHMRRIHKARKGGRKINSVKENVEVAEEVIEKNLDHNVEEVDQDNEEEEETIETKMELDHIDDNEQVIEDVDVNEKIEDTQPIDFEIKEDDGTQTQQMLEENSDAVQYIILSDDQQIEYIISTPDYIIS